ncbi:Uncharacterised protein [Mycobacteroides abscessus subsp. abscessus]|nr:Uncharacterised protein [Mycobacteroides abscessus subsp. abscessus]
MCAVCSRHSARNWLNWSLTASVRCRALAAATLTLSAASFHGAVIQSRMCGE